MRRLRPSLPRNSELGTRNSDLGTRTSGGCLKESPEAQRLLLRLVGYWLRRLPSREREDAVSDTILLVWKAVLGRKPIRHWPALARQITRWVAWRYVDRAKKARLRLVAMEAVLEISGPDPAAEPSRGLTDEQAR